MRETTNSIYGKCITITEKGVKTSFYPEHYRKVARAKGLEEIKKHHFNGEENGFIVDSDYAKTFGTGKKYLNNGGYYYIQAAHQHWFHGYYIMLLAYTIMDNGSFSHTNIFVENINSLDETIIDSVEENKSIVFEESTLQEKIDIIISKRKKKNLPAVIHINKYDAKNINTIDITKTENINELIEAHKLSKEPLLLSGGMSWVNMQYTNFDMEVIQLDGIDEKTYNDLKIIYLHRNYEG